MSVLVCIPTSRGIDPGTAQAAFGLCANHPGGASFRTVRAHPVDRCRTLCAQGFLSSPHEHLLFLDDDVLPPPETLEWLLALEAPIATGMYPLQLGDEVCLSVAQRMGPDAYGFLHDLPDGPFEVDTAGLGCCLIRREVFETLPEPWFQLETRPDGLQSGEDVFFFERCAEAGIRTVADPAVLCGHQRNVNLLPLWRALRGAAVTA